MGKTDTEALRNRAIDLVRLHGRTEDVVKQARYLRDQHLRAVPDKLRRICSISERQTALAMSLTRGLPARSTAHVAIIRYLPPMLLGPYRDDSGNPFLLEVRYLSVLLLKEANWSMHEVDCHDLMMLRGQNDVVVFRHGHDRIIAATAREDYIEAANLVHDTLARRYIKWK